MPSFSQQPLTWLFFIATACLDAVVFASDHEVAWVSSLTVGQTLVAGGWLALGRSHRLARAVIFITLILALASPYFYHGNRVGELRFVLGTLIACGAATAIAAGVWARLRHLNVRPWAFKSGIRYSVAEILGWMIVVAVASVALREAEFRHLVASPLMPAVIVALAAVAALLMTLYLPNDRPSASWAYIAGGLAVVLLFAALPMVISRPALKSNFGAFVYVGLWILVRRLDERLRSSAVTEAAPASGERVNRQA